MKAGLLILPRADADLADVRPDDLRRVVEVLEFLCDYPHAAQTADLMDAPQVRRAVAGQYLIYYRHDPDRHAILVYTVRHGHRRPPEAADVLGPED